MPALPLYARTLGIPESQIGFIIGFFAISSMLVKPVAGWAADRYGRRSLMLAGAVLFLVSSLLYGGSRTVGSLLGVRIIHGAGMGLYPTGSAAMVADLSPAARRGEAMGAWGASGYVALALGPLIGVWVSARLGFLWLFGLSASLALLALAVAFAQRETVTERRSVRLRAGALLSRAGLFPCLIVFCLMATYGMQAAFLPLYAQARGTNPGVFFLVLALVVAVVRGYAGQLSDRLGRPPVATAGMGLTAAALALLGVSGAPLMLALAGALYGLGLGAAQPALMAWTVDLVSPAERGKALGTYYTALEMGIAAGAIGFGMVLSGTSFAVMFLLAALVASAGGVLAATRLKQGISAT